MAALNAEVTRQAAMVAYVDDFKLERNRSRGHAARGVI